MDPPPSHSSSLKVLEVCHVSPPPNSAPETILPLTYIDIPYLLRPPSELLLFFSLSIQTDDFMDTLLPKIKHSFSLALQHFAPLAGNLEWSPGSDKPLIRYTNGDYVQVTIAESSLNFNHLSSYNARDPQELKLLVPPMSSSTKQVPSKAIQITLFPNSGFTMSIVTNHAVMDGRSAAHFVSLWATICRSGIDGYEGPFPSYDRTLVKGPSGIEEHFIEELVKFIRSMSMSEHDMNNWLSLAKRAETLEDAVFTTFELSLANISKLKQMILDTQNKMISTGNETTPLLLNPSRFEVASAYTWICLTKADMQVRASNSDDETTTIIVSADYRSRSNPPLPSNYFGNCSVSIRVTAKKNEILGEGGIVAAVRKIRSEIKGLGETIEVNLKHRAARMMSSGPEQFRTIAGSTQFAFYKLDFGWGRPCKVDYLSIVTSGALFFADSRKDEGGIEISLVRSKKVMEAFRFSFANVLGSLVH
ncbi:hypothetical protein Scep_009270 [Stephania cephalantha]|uniref:Uncharacterized protein n=1 Tax=Stephania cephalantha TaxID=152367 RepID=A0AAP0JTF6_9MAGN